MSFNYSIYERYKAANPGFSEATFRCAERTVEKLINQSTSSDHPGMLLGKVQSGKTRTFISVMALAFDTGFDIAVVLSKNSKALIQQTEKRLRKEFSEFIDDEQIQIYDIMSAPKSFNKFELESKLIFIAKKQTDNLRRLLKLFTANPDLASRRVLIVDDEADSASIGYSKKQNVIEARRIATQISELRKAIRDVSFLQVTATPYSLYLQPEEVIVPNVAAFRPTRPAFTELVPVPDDYVGGETYFGANARSSDETLESLIHHSVDHREFDCLKRQDKRVFKIDQVLHTTKLEGYRRAILNFLVGGCIKRMESHQSGNSIRKKKYSFLLHSEAVKDAHDWQSKVTDTLLTYLKKSAVDEDVLFLCLVRASYEDLSRSMILDSCTPPTFLDVLNEVKAALVDEKIMITKVNSDDDVAALLDDQGQLKLRAPLNIFLGGQVLDRGITIANLIGFYYGRRPNKFQQDTVLQHSRMYGYRRPDLAVTRFYTSPAIRGAMSQMEEFDASLRNAIESGGDGAVQFIRQARDGSIVPCSPNKILVSTTQTLRPHKRILPIGFQSGYRTGSQGIERHIKKLDKEIETICGFAAKEPTLIPLEKALHMIDLISNTLFFEDDDAPAFDWSAATAALIHLTQQSSDPNEREKVWLWAASDRDSARLAGESSHARYIETPDSEKTEGQIAKRFAINQPIIFLLRQNGREQKGWRGTPFYWPVIRAQSNTPTAIYTAETIS